MPHVALVPFTGLRVREQEMLKLGMRLPGLRKRADALAGLPALGLLTLAGMTPASWTCSYHPSADSTTLLDDVRATNPDLVAVSALTASVLEAYQFCDALKADGIQSAIGGLHATVLPDEAAQHATAVCVGDGEASWLQILEDAQQKCLQSVYRPAKPIALADSPLPRFELQGRKIPQRWTIQTQRGCPWACDFCGASRLLGPARYKTVHQIANELNAILALDVTPWIELADDNTFAGRKDSIEMLEVIRQAGVHYFTESDWRIGEDPSLVEALAKSGCVQVLVGVESLSFRYSGMGRKGAGLSRMMAAVDRLQAAGVVVNGCFIAGAEGETDQTLDRMAQFIDESSFAEVQLTLQTPFPGTGLYRRLKRENRLLADRDWSYYTLFDVVYEPDKMSVADLEAGFRRTLQTVFGPAGAAKRESLRRKVWRKNFMKRKSTE